MAVFALSLIILHRFVFLYGDDYYYGTFGSKGFANFFNMHGEHYMTVNGRAVVHFLVSLLLLFDVYIWRILNPFLILFTLYFLTKIIYARKPENIKTAGFTAILAVSMGLFLFIDIAVARESIYWLDGSVNYLYPVFMLSLTVYMFDKNRNFLPLLCFFAGAATEQAGIMTVGMLVMMLSAAKIKKIKIKRVNYISAACCLAGYMTVALAPGTFWRVNYENAGFSADNLIRAVKFFFAARQSAVFIILTLFSALYIFIKISHELYAKNRRKNVLGIHTATQIFMSLTLAFYIIFTAFNLELQDTLIILIAVAVSLSSGYVFALYFSVRGNILPLAFFIVSLGAQIFMAVTDAAYYRTLLCSILALLPCIITGVTELKKPAALGAAGLSAVCGIIGLSALFIGYGANYPVHIYNIEQIKKLKSDDSVEYALFKPIIDERYNCALLLQNSNYHIARLEDYYNIPRDTVFIDVPEYNRLFVNGERVYTNAPPMLRETEKVYCAGVRDIAKAFGYKVDWDGENNAVIIITEDGEVYIKIEGETTVFDGKEYIIFNKNSRFMIEIDFYRDALGLNIDIVPNGNKSFDIMIY